MNERTERVSGLQKKWGSTIAVKITAPVLWAIIVIGMVVAVISQQNIADDIADELNRSADYYAYQLQQRINKTKGDVAAKDRLWLREQIQKGFISAVNIMGGGKLVVIGQSEKNSVEIKREIYLNNIDGLVEIIFKHPPVDVLVKSNRRELLVSVGAPILLFAFILTGLIHYTLTRPISELMEATKLAAGGVLTKRIKTVRDDEFGHLSVFFNEMLDKLEEQQKNLELAVRSAEDASSAKSTFLANMSHEIRTPLTAIIGFSEMLRDGDLTDTERANEISSIVRSGIHLQQVINDVLDLSKIEAGQLDIEQVEISPFEVMEDIRVLFSSRAKEKGINFSVKYEYPIPSKIITDPTRLKQIIVNLCSNAVKFTHEGSVNLLVRYLKNDNHLLISVSDTGAGISEEEQQRIFLPFTQADSSITRQYGGTGLGLCISRQLAEMLRGEIRCNSKKGIGSQFILEFDAGAVAKNSLVNSYVNVENETNILSKNTRYLGQVLLAEDNEENRRLLGFYLKRAGVNFIAVGDGAKAVQYAVTEDVDLILMDMQMPILDGVSAIRILRQQGFNKPIVVLTANVLAEDREACKQAGSNEFLSKPIDVKRFYSILDHYLEKAPL